MKTTSDQSPAGTKQALACRGPNRRVLVSSFRRLAFLLAGAFAGLPLHAGGDKPDPNYLVFSSGAGYALARSKTPLFAAEYRCKENYKGIHPYLLGGWGPKDSATYLGAGLLYNFELSPPWRITISSGPGYYERNHSPMDLGNTIEFYSNFEVSAKVWRGHRLGLSFGHVSNGGLGKRNPGSETLRVVYAMPFR
jgi:hypothetical protein